MSVSNINLTNRKYSVLAIHACLLKSVRALEGQGIFTACLMTGEELEQRASVSQEAQHQTKSCQTTPVSSEIPVRKEDSSEFPELNIIPLEIAIHSLSQDTYCVKFYRGNSRFPSPTTQLLFQCVISKEPDDNPVCEDYVSADVPLTEELASLDSECSSLLYKGLEPLSDWRIENTRINVSFILEFYGIRNLYISCTDTDGEWQYCLYSTCGRGRLRMFEYA